MRGGKRKMADLRAIDCRIHTQGKVGGYGGKEITAMKVALRKS
jgi:hypothetical protein